MDMECPNRFIEEISQRSAGGQPGSSGGQDADKHSWWKVARTRKYVSVRACVCVRARERARVRAHARGGEV